MTLIGLMNSIINILDLPDELVYQIFEYLDPKHLLHSVQVVCRCFHQLVLRMLPWIWRKVSFTSGHHVLSWIRREEAAPLTHCSSSPLKASFVDDLSITSCTLTQGVALFFPSAHIAPDEAFFATQNNLLDLLDTSIRPRFSNLSKLSLKCCVLISTFVLGLPSNLTSLALNSCLFISAPSDP